MAASAKELDKKVQDEKLLQMIEAFMDENKAYIDTFFKAYVGSSSSFTYTKKSFMRDFKMQAESFGVVQYLINLCNRVTDYADPFNKYAMKIEDLNLFIDKCIAPCLRLVGPKDADKQWVTMIFGGLDDRLRPKLMDLLIEIGFNFNEVIDQKDTSCNNVPLVHLVKFPKSLDHFLKIVKTPFPDEVCVQAIKKAIADKKPESAVLIQKYRINQHGKSTASLASSNDKDVKRKKENGYASAASISSAASAAVDSTETVISDLDNKNTKENEENFLHKWEALIRMENTMPGYMQNLRNLSIVNPIYSGFETQYGFHPMLSNSERYKNNLTQFNQKMTVKEDASEYLWFSDDDESPESAVPVAPARARSKSLP